MAAGWDLGLEQGQAGNHAVKTRDGDVVGLGGLSAVSGLLPMLADAEGARGRVYAAEDEVPQVGLGKPAVVLDERGDAVFGEAESEREEKRARSGGETEKA